MGQLTGPTDPAADAGWADRKPRKGFFTDTSICIGCKACEVACKEWNRNPRDGDLELLGSSYDNTGALGRQHLAARRVHRAGPRPHRRGTRIRARANRFGYARVSRRPRQAGQFSRRTPRSFAG